MELIDIYDKDGNATGKVAEKGSPLGEGEYRLAVGIWLVDGDGRIFLTKRSMEKSYAPGKWENTAGHVQAGESPVHAIIRELKEETGVDIREEQIAFLGDSRTWPYLGKDYGVRLHVNLEDVTFQKGETCGAKWATFEEFLDMMRAGEFPLSLTEHLKQYQRAFLKFIGRPDGLEEVLAEVCGHEG